MARLRASAIWLVASGLAVVLVVLVTLVARPRARGRPDPGPASSASSASPAPPAATGTAEERDTSPPRGTVRERFAPPPGYVRTAVPEGSFAAWLRRFPVRAGRPPVRRHDGRLKPRQDVHAAVLDLDVGTRDLQQCADSVIRLRAEHLRAAGRENEIEFRFTSGHPARFRDWAAGLRPVVSGASVRWRPGGRPGRDDRAFRAYLETVFIYAGTLSLARDLRHPGPDTPIRGGDVLVVGGSPGHAAIVLDVAASREGEGRVFLVAQGFMPAEEMHVLRNLADSRLGPWFEWRPDAPVRTPQWVFPPGSRRRFPETR